MTENTWRNLALQFDAHRMQAIQLLKYARYRGLQHRKQIDDFLNAPPLQGENVLAERLEAMRLDKMKDCGHISYFEAVERLRNEVKSHGSISKLAKHLEYSPGMISDVLNERKPMPQDLAEVLGMKRHKKIVYTFSVKGKRQSNG